MAENKASGAFSLNVEEVKPNPNHTTYWFNIERIEKLETALRDIRNLHTPVGDETQPGAVHRAVVVGIVDAALEAK